MYCFFMPVVGGKNNCQSFILQIFGTVGVPSQWWCTSMVALTWKALEIYMMGVSWQAMAMWSSSQSTIGLGYLVRYFLFLSLFIIKYVIVFCLLSSMLPDMVFECKFLKGSMRSLKVHILSKVNLGKIQMCSGEVMEALIAKMFCMVWLCKSMEADNGKGQINKSLNKDVLLLFFSCAVWGNKNAGALLCS